MYQTARVHWREPVLFLKVLHVLHVIHVSNLVITVLLIRFHKGRRKNALCLDAPKGVVHIPRHLREVHKWNKHRDRAAVNRFTLRKNYTSSNPWSCKVASTKKDYHRWHCCPMPKCGSVVKRLSSHLQKQIKMNRNTSEYKGAVTRAIIMSHEPHIFTHLKMQVVTVPERLSLYYIFVLITRSQIVSHGVFTSHDCK